jgi:hypothetical protein
VGILSGILVAMSRRHWLGYGSSVALGIAVIIASVVVTLFCYHQKQTAQRHEAAAAHQERAINQAREACRNVGSFVDRMNCVTREIEANAYEKHADYDLDAQQNMALWALGVLIVSGWGLLVTGAGVVYVALTLQANRESVKAAYAAIDVTRKIGVAEASPYISIIDSKIIAKGEGGEAHFSVKNFGQTPAYGVVVSTNCPLAAGNL